MTPGIRAAGLVAVPDPPDLLDAPALRETGTGGFGVTPGGTGPFGSASRLNDPRIEPHTGPLRGRFGMNGVQLPSADIVRQQERRRKEARGLLRGATVIPQEAEEVAIEGQQI